MLKAIQWIKIATDMITNATNMSSLAAKHSALVALCCIDDH